MFELHLRKLNQYLSVAKNTIVLPSLVIALNFNTSAFAEKITLGTGEFPPYISSELKNGGAITNIVTASFALVGYQSNVDYIPWNRAFKLADNGRIDGTFAWSIKADRQVAFYYSKPLFIFEQKAFALKENDFNLSLNAPIKSINLCRPQGYAIQGLSKELIDNGIANHFSPPDVESCFNMLKVGRVDIVVVDKLEGRSYVAKQFSSTDDVKTLDKVFYKYSNHLLISKKHPQANKMIKEFNRGLDNLMDSGEYQNILFNELGL